jgi:hypothetical protein
VSSGSERSVGCWVLCDVVLSGAKRLLLGKSWLEGKRKKEDREAVDGFYSASWVDRGACLHTTKALACHIFVMGIACLCNT